MLYNVKEYRKYIKAVFRKEQSALMKYGYYGNDNAESNRKRQYIINEKTPFVISESYKTARTNLFFALSKTVSRAVVITSCSPGEGKSTTCANLAITLGLSGEKTLLIDADLRKPTIHSLLALKNRVGLSGVLTGKCNVREAINAGVRTKLDVMTAGIIPPNPSELLGSDNMRDLIRLLHDYYDYILIDTPPVNVVTDSQLLNTVSAGILFVARESVTTHSALKKAMQSIELADGHILGVIKTGCEVKPGFGKRYTAYGRLHRTDYT